MNPITQKGFIYYEDGTTPGISAGYYENPYMTIMPQYAGDTGIINKHSIELYYSDKDVVPNQLTPTVIGYDLSHFDYNQNVMLNRLPIDELPHGAFLTNHEIKERIELDVNAKFDSITLYDVNGLNKENSFVLVKNNVLDTLDEGDFYYKDPITESGDPDSDKDAARQSQYFRSVVSVGSDRNNNNQFKTSALSTQGYLGVDIKSQVEADHAALGEVNYTYKSTIDTLLNEKGIHDSTSVPGYVDTMGWIFPTYIPNITEIDEYVKTELDILNTDISLRLSQRTKVINTTLHYTWNPEYSDGTFGTPIQKSTELLNSPGYNDIMISDVSNDLQGSPTGDRKVRQFVGLQSFVNVDTGLSYANTSGKYTMFFTDASENNVISDWYNSTNTYSKLISYGLAVNALDYVETIPVGVTDKDTIVSTFQPLRYQVSDNYINHLVDISSGVALDTARRDVIRFFGNYKYYDKLDIIPKAAVESLLETAFIEYENTAKEYLGGIYSSIWREIPDEDIDDETFRKYFRSTGQFGLQYNIGQALPYIQIDPNYTTTDPAFPMYGHFDPTNGMVPAGTKLYIWITANDRSNVDWYWILEKLKFDDMLRISTTIDDVLYTGDFNVKIDETQNIVVEYIQDANDCPDPTSVDDNKCNDSSRTLKLFKIPVELAEDSNLNMINDGLNGATPPTEREAPHYSCEITAYLLPRGTVDTKDVYVTDGDPIAGFLDNKIVGDGVTITTSVQNDLTYGQQLVISSSGGSGSGLWYNDANTIKNLNNNPVMITTNGTAGSNIVVTQANSPNDGSFAGEYVDSGLVDNQFGKPVFVSGNHRMIIDSTNNYYCIDTDPTNLTPPVYHTTHYVNFVVGSALGEYTHIAYVDGVKGYATIGSGGISGTALEVNGAVQIHDGLFFESKSMIQWNDNLDYLEIGIITPQNGASYVIKMDGTPRLAIPISGAGNATQFYRSALFGGYTVGNESANADINVSNTFFDASYIECDTGAFNSDAKPDVGIGGSLQVMDGILIGGLQSSGDRIEITTTDILKNGVSIITGGGGSIPGTAGQAIFSNGGGVAQGYNYIVGNGTSLKLRRTGSDSDGMIWMNDDAILLSLDNNGTKPYMELKYNDPNDYKFGVALHGTGPNNYCLYLSENINTFGNHLNGGCHLKFTEGADSELLSPNMPMIIKANGGSGLGIVDLRGSHVDSTDGELLSMTTIPFIDNGNNRQITTKEWVLSKIGSSGGGDVSGPTSTTADGNITLFDGTSGKIIKDSGKQLTDYMESNSTIDGGTF